MRGLPILLLLCVLTRPGWGAPPPIESRSIDDMEDIADWGFARSEETELRRSESTKHAGRSAMVFATTVNHKAGEKNYPIGWPRTYKALKAHGLTDWSEWDVFEGWIYATSSRDSLPANALSLGLYHSGPKEASRFPIKDLKLGQWTKFTIPVSRISKPMDVQRVQFNISESDYRHGDQVDFIFDDLLLTRPTHSVIDSVSVDRRILYTGEGRLDVAYRLLGFRSTADARIRLQVGPQGQPPVGRAEHTAERTGVLAVRWGGERPAVGTWTVQAELLDAEKRTLDRKQTTLRVIRGPFDEE